MFCRCLRGTSRMWRRSPAQNEMPVRIKQGRDGGGVPVDPETRSKT